MTVPIVEGETMYAALVKAGVAASFVRVEGAGHGFEGADLVRVNAAQFLSQRRKHSPERQRDHFVSSSSSRAHHHRINRPPAARTGAILASVSRADFALALRKAFQSPPARWWRRSVR